MRCVSWKPLKRGAMLGFADLQLSNGMILIGCILFESSGKSWCSPPSRPQLDADRRVMFGDDGKVAYMPVIEFVDKRTRWAWSDAAVAAIAAFEGSGGGIEAMADDAPPPTTKVRRAEYGPLPNVAGGVADMPEDPLPWR